MRRLLLLLLPALAAMAVLGCPLDIQVRCDESSPCKSGEVCVAGACEREQEPRGAPLGGACASDTGCDEGLTCGAGFPGGYCLVECGAGGACPSDSVCVPELGRCLRACGEGCDRPGYACVGVPYPNSPTQACAPSGGGQGDGGTPDGGCVGNVPLGERCSRACECAASGASCDEGFCQQPCVNDSACPDDRRCNERTHRCEVGPRLGETCRETLDCQSFAFCNTTRRRCEMTCSTDWGCAPGFRCGPDSLCIEDCSSVPETVGLTCESSMDCARCGFCVPVSDAEKRCRQPCYLDRDCPGGATGACEQLSGSTLRACRLP
ncbi:hypothetical protein P2318_31660 [Myxococcaceae bacterium GXIMD 01537]